MHYKKHIFICTNQKVSGKKCCQDGDAKALQQYAKQKLMEMGLHGKDNFRINAAGCLGRCGMGPNLLVYPDGVWYHYDSREDIDEIIESHLLNGQVVERLLIDK